MSSRVQTFGGGDTPSTAVRSALQAAGFDLAESGDARRMLFDTFDGRLQDAGLRLEHRTVGDVRQLVLLDDQSPPATLAAAEPPRFATDLAAGPFRSRIGAVTDGRALLPMRTVAARTIAIVSRNRSDKTVATATIYEDLTIDGEPNPWTVEVTELLGYDRAADRLGDVLCGCGLVAASGDVLELAGPICVPGRATASPTIPLDGAEAAAEAFRKVLTHLLQAIEVNLPGTIDDLDAEFLHELRVAVRRSRSVLSHAKRVLPADDVARARTELAWLGSITSPPRDLDVYQLEWGDYIRHLSPAAGDDLEAIRVHLDQQRRHAHRDLAAELGRDHTDDVLRWWRDVLTAPPTGPAVDAETPAGKVVRRQIRRAHRRLVEQGRAIDDASPAEEVHELRKDAKRLRYLLECFGGLYPGKPRKAFVARLKALQDNLGAHQDADVHGQHLRALTAQLAGQLPVATVLAAGQLIEQLDQRRTATRADFAERFAEFDSAATEAALRKLLAGSAP